MPFRHENVVFLANEALSSRGRENTDSFVGNWIWLRLFDGSELLLEKVRLDCKTSTQRTVNDFIWVHSQTAEMQLRKLDRQFARHVRMILGKMNENQEGCKSNIICFAFRSRKWLTQQRFHF